MSDGTDVGMWSSVVTHTTGYTFEIIVRFEERALAPLQ